MGAINPGEIKSISFYVSKAEFKKLDNTTIQKLIKTQKDDGSSINFEIKEFFKVGDTECCFLYLSQETKGGTVPNWVSFMNNK